LKFGRSNPWHVQEIVDVLKGAMGLSVLDDALGCGGPDLWEAFKLAESGGVDVDGACGLPRASAARQGWGRSSLSNAWYIDLLLIEELLGQVDVVHVGALDWAASGSDCIVYQTSGREKVDGRESHSTTDIDTQRPGCGSGR
jgi:hypothetical protein